MCNAWVIAERAGTARGTQCKYSGIQWRVAATPDVKCSMMAAKISGLSAFQGRSSLLVTVTKSEPKKTPVTPSIWNRRLASGDLRPSRAVSKLALPDCSRAAQQLAGVNVYCLWTKKACRNLLADQ